MNSGRRVLLGRIVGVHGLRGAVKLESFTEPRTSIFGYKPWLLEREPERFEEIAGADGHAQGKGIVATLPGVADRDAAAAWIGARIWVPREALPELEPGEFYQTDLEGLQVVNETGDDLGRVTHLFDNGAHDVLMTRDEAGRERLIPYVVDVYVKSVDLDAGRIVVDWHKDDLRQDDVRIDVVTLFPEFVRQCAGFGVIGRAVERRLLEVEAWNPRDYAEGGYRRVDDSVCGGGPGMVMLIEPLRKALTAARQAATDKAPVIYLSPQGKRLTQDKVRQLASLPRMILLCGRYEGIDERLVEREVDEELSIGDYVLSGGELAAAVVIDAIGRLQEGALGDTQSAAQDSFSDGLLDCPHYTRPVSHEFGEVPAVLLSGDHAAINRWRRMQALGRTWLRRPELLENLTLDENDQRLLEEFKQEHKGHTHEQDH